MVDGQRANEPGEGPGGGRPRLTVVHVTNSRTLSGGAVQAVLLARGLREAGHRVIACAPAQCRVAEAFAGAGVELRPLVFGNPVGQWKASRALRRVVAEVGADIVHTHHTKGHNVGVLATFGGAFPPLVVKRGVTFRVAFPLKFRTPRVAAIAVNARAARDVLTSQGVDPAKIRVIYNAKELPDLAALAAAGPTLRRELVLEGDGPVIGTVGNARPEKGFQFLVEAAPEILAAHPGARFLLVGAGTEALRPRLRELGLEDRFRLPGRRDDVLELMALMDVFVFPGIDMDSCSNVILEAMSAARPIVCSDMQGTDELLPPGAGVAAIFERGNAHALAERVLGVLEGAGPSATMGTRARGRVEHHHSLPAHVEEVVALYRQLLALRGGAGGRGRGRA